ncbi:hypothetical protein MMC07_006385 [Pseudocyphellaria aurata]|nr:hypothetical protein [Pseudocyphellaria aurata]
MLVPELWQDHGDTIIFLHTEGTNLGPSFKLDSACYASSKKLSLLVGRTSQTGHRRSSSQIRERANGDQSPNSSLHPPSPTPPPGSPPMGSWTNDGSSGSQGRRIVSDSLDEGVGEVHLHIPLPLQADLTLPEPLLTPDDIETLVAIRNVFAFLIGEPLVVTSRQSSIFSIFLRIANFLHRYEFANLDGSTLGQEVAENFGRCLREFKLADVRTSREKTIEAVVLGERMKSFELYSEGFVHAVGRYDDIIKLQSPKFHLITDITRLRLERAQIDLSTRLKTVRNRLKDFEFPALFSGIASSTTSTESKLVRFKAWRFSFLAMRRHVMSFYRQRYGAWPPSAKSKKNSFEESGLNRILLLELYQDFCHLYDVLVNRDVLTTRSTELNLEAMSTKVDTDESAPAMRRVLGEFDHSSPPVQPPIPFDTPLLPSLTTTRRGYNSLEPKHQKKERMKPLEDDEINQALMQSYNRDSIKATPFLEAFMSFERKQAHGKSIEEITELRNGQWMFLYAVLQSLPLVVIDAPDAKWTEGVEYFLCEVPKGTPPWCPEDSSRKMSWYGIAGGMGVVSLPAELVEHGVEGIYRRSHCWEVAENWASNGEVDILIDSYQSPENLPTPTLQLPTDFLESDPIEPVLLKKRNSIHIGLEALPLPAGVLPHGAKSSSYHDPQKSFADILEQLSNKAETKKK